MRMTVLHTRYPWRRFLPAGVSPDFVPPETTMPALFAQTVRAHGALPMLDYYGEVITYADMARKVTAIAAALAARGIGRGDVVALYLPNCPWHPAWLFGAWAAGAAVTHLSPLDPPPTLEHKLADSGARLLVTLSAEPFCTNATGLVGNRPDLGLVMCNDAVALAGTPHAVPATAQDHDAFIAARTPREPSAPVTPDNVALLQYTGGTTGKPRAACLTHRNLSAATLIYCEWFRAEPHAGPGQSVLVYSPLFHILGLTTNLLRRVAEGGTVYLRQRFDAAEAVELIERHRIAAFGGVPTTWIALTQLPGIDRRDLSSLSYAGSGGAPLPVEVERRVRQLTGLDLRGGWGMTETAPAGTNIPLHMPAGKEGTIGIPLPGIEMQIVAADDPQRVLPPGQTGELRIRGPNVTTGYHNCPEETRMAFADGWLLTGDLGHMDADGFFFLTDRKKDLIVSSGFNVYPLTIENAIHEHPDVAEAAVIGIAHPYRGEVAKAFVILRAGAPDLSLAQLNAFLAGRLGRHEMPSELELRATLPTTAVGKTSRRALRDAELARRAGRA